MGKLFNRKNDKNSGLSEMQRLELAKFEQEQQRKILESKARLDENLAPFKKEYADLVEEYGIKHVVRLAFKEGTPEWVKDMIVGVCGPMLSLAECREEIDNEKKSRSGVVKPE